MGEECQTKSMEKDALRIGLFGGSFDPIHLGHLLVAENAYESLNLDRVDFLPAYHPPHKSGKENSAEERLAMLELAIKDNPHFSIDLREINSKSMRYSVDTIKEWKADHPNWKLFFIIGEDSLLSIDSWYHPRELLSLTSIIVARRLEVPGNLQKKIEQLREEGFDLTMIDRYTNSISSSQIREDVRQGRSIRYAVPPQVEKYIYQKRLYID